MSKVLKIAAEVVGAVALVATGIGAIGGGAIIGSLTFATVGTVAGVAATALTLAATALTKPPGTTISGNQDKFTASLDQGVPYAIGRTAVSGWIVHRQTFDWAGSKPSNAFQSFFAVWGGGGPYHAVEAFQVDGTAVTFSGDVGNDCAQGAYNDGHNTGWMWHHRQLGACPEPTALKAEGFYPYPSGWTAASGLSGYAAFSWTLKFDPSGKAYPGAAVPQPRGILQGALVYDPRQDSTYPGGSGACRPLVESTYVYSENPALHALTWALGRWQNGKRVLGIGMALGAIVVPAYADAANVADANGWKVGGVVYSTDGKWDVMKKMLAACSAEPLQLGGTLSCMIDTPRVSLATITDDDIIGKCTVPGNPRIVDRLNGVIPTCRLEASDWQLVPCAKVSVPAYIASDGKPRTKAITWELVQDAGQVAQLATYAICNSREIDGIVLPLKLRWIGYKPGDALTVASSTVGLDNQLIVLRKRHLDPSTGAVTMTSRTETASKHPFALGQTTTPPPAPALQAVDRTQLLQPGISAAWSAVADDSPATRPRPADGATVGAPPGTTVGDRDALAVTQALDFNTNTMAQQILRLDGYQQILAARTLINGVDVATTIQSFQLQQTTANSSFAQTISLLGSSINGGTAFQLNANSVITDNGVALSTRLSTTEATVANNSGSITNLQQVVIDPTGTTVRAVMQLNVNGQISGTIATNNGAKSTFAVVANVFQIVDPNSGKPFTPFIYANGVITMKKVVVDTLDVNTAIIPVRGAATASVAGTAGSGAPSGATATQSILSMTVIVPVSGWINVQGALHSAFGKGFAGGQPWAAKIQVDGADLPESVSFGTGPGDSVTMLGSVMLNAGTHTVAMLWNGSSDVTALNRALIATGFPNTQ